MRSRLATYVEVPFPYPVTYQSDGRGGLVQLPAMRVPTSVVQAQQTARGCGCAGQCGAGCRCGGACGRKRLHGWRGLRSRRRLGDDTGDFGSGIDAGSFDTGSGSVDTSGDFSFIDSLAQQDFSAPPGAADAGSGDVSLANTASATFTDENGNTVFVDSNGNMTNEGVFSPSTTSRSVQAQSPTGGGASSGGGPKGGGVGSGSGGLSASQLAALLKSLSTQSGKLIASQAGITPAQLTAQHQAALLNQASLNSGSNFLTQNFGGLAVWQWGLGIAGVTLFIKSVSGGSK